MVIQWFPGHMTKARRLLVENVALVDLVLELRDARVPVSGANPLINELIGKKPRLIVFTKEDLADPRLTQAHLAHFQAAGSMAVALDVRDRRKVRKLLGEIRKATSPLLPTDRKTGSPLRAARILVAGIPNVGKSTLINTFSDRSATKTGALPGVTRAKQWIRLTDGVELLDTPGLLWPRIDDGVVAFRLAVTGSIGEGGFVNTELAASLLAFLSSEYPELLKDRYGISLDDGADGYALLAAVAGRRGLLVQGGQPDHERSANVVLSEFRQGKLGRITLDQELDRYDD
ncbi:MAG TPA: ribosome biogenesis GTPase YlqF [Bacillota bacterium]|nr:ribosome biogenesis GTPase YlqF [Bacillota bacterium]